MLSLYLIGAVDTPLCTTPETLQLKSMMFLLNVKDNRDLTDILKTNNLETSESKANPQNICGWKGIWCVNKIINMIRWKGSKQKFQCRIKWLPATLQDIRLHDMRISETFDTRFLPRKTLFCKMYMCMLSGNVNMRTLPLDIEELYLRANNLEGTVDLTRLPERLRKADLCLNSFKKVIVSNESLPKNLIHIYFNQPGQKIRATVIEGKKADARIHLKANMYASLVDVTLNDSAFTLSGSESFSSDDSY